jgi:hypothetical protein
VARRSPAFPAPLDRALTPYALPEPGTWLVLCDVHVPFHDRQTVELAVDDARRRKITGVLFNGDTLDMHELSRFDKSPDEPRYVEEVDLGRQLLKWMRHRLPRAVFVWKDGNHEERLYKYLVQRAPALFGLITIPELLRFDDVGVEYVTDRRVVQAGKLSVIHGHEYPGSATSPVNPARGLFLKAKGNAICGHHHQTSEHHEPTITGKPQGAWSVGCACGLSPGYMPLNKWNNGFAFVHFDGTGWFGVDNKRVIEGQVL